MLEKLFELTNLGFKLSVESFSPDYIQVKLSKYDRYVVHLVKKSRTEHWDKTDPETHELITIELLTMLTRDFQLTFGDLEVVHGPDIPAILTKGGI